MAITTDDIAIALGKAAPAQDSLQAKQWELWIEEAAMLIETRRLKLDADQPDEAKLDYVIRQAVVAHIQHPDNATQVTVAVDDGSTSRTYRSGRGRVVILDEWWDLLELTSPSGGAYSIDMVGYGSSPHADICALNFGGVYCSCGAVLTNLLYPLYERT